MAHHINDYIRAYEIKGIQQFRRDYEVCVIMGLNVVGDLSEDGERGEAQTFLAAIHGQQQQAQSLNRRIWPVVKSPYGPQTAAIRVGRSSDNDMVIPEYSISHIHCQFSVREDNRLQIMDLDSHNGTLVNGERLRRGQVLLLEDQDELVLGRYLFEFLSARTFVERVRRMASMRVA